MKMRIGVVVLIVACVVLVIAVIATRKQASNQRKTDVDTILDFSNQWVETSGKVDELRQVDLMLTNDLAASRQTLMTLSNQFVETSESLSNSLKAAQDQISALN